MVIRGAPEPELSLAGKSHTAASCLHWLFIYASKCLRNRRAINGSAFLCGGGVTSPRPPGQHRKRHLEDRTPSLPTCGSWPSNEFLGTFFPGSQQAAWNKPASHLVPPSADRTPQSSAHLRHLCVAPPLATSADQASGSSRGSQELLARLRHTCSALLKRPLGMGMETPSPFICG